MTRRIRALRRRWAVPMWTAYRDKKGRQHLALWREGGGEDFDHIDVVVSDRQTPGGGCDDREASAPSPRLPLTDCERTGITKGASHG